MIYHAFLDYNWIYGTLIFFYIQAYIDADFKFQRKDWLHFLPVGIEFLLSNYVKTQNFYWDGTRESLSWLGEKTYILWMHTPFQIIITGGLILYYVWRSKKLLTTYTTDNTKPVQTEDVNWLDLMLKIYSGFTIMLGAGYLQHKIQIEDRNTAVPQFQGEYRKGYDRLSSGLAFSQFIGYTHLSLNRRINFYIGIEATQAFTEGRRSIHFNTKADGTGSRTDILFGPKVGWVLTIYKEPSEGFYVD